MATLASVRQDFVRITKRYDLLVNGDFSSNVDNGVNRYINNQ